MKLHPIEAAGWAFFWLSLLSYYVAKTSLFHFGGRNEWVVWLCATLTGFALGPTLVRLGRRLHAERRQLSDTAQRDLRKPILLLRPFAYDGTARLPDPLNGIIPDSDEENLADLFRDYGPLVAIGAPGEKLSRPGARRTYLDDNEWEAHVIGRMQDCQFAVMLAGNSRALQWELSAAREHLSPADLLIIVPRRRWFSRDTYARFRSGCLSENGLLLPEGLKFPAWISFSSDWTPIPLQPPKRNLWQRWIDSVPRTNSWLWYKSIQGWIDERSLHRPSEIDELEKGVRLYSVSLRIFAVLGSFILVAIGLLALLAMLGVV